jgi:hypothetical protein
MLARIQGKVPTCRFCLGMGVLHSLGHQFLCLLDKRLDASDCSLRGIATNEGVGSYEFTRKPLVVD